MSYYDDIYKLRLNRYGLNYQSRMLKKREKEFQLYLSRSVYKIEFTYNNIIYTGSFEQYRQNETKNLHYLLTDRSVLIDPGTIIEVGHLYDTNNLQLTDDIARQLADNTLCFWMVYYLDVEEASGYNRYVMLKMTHYLSWIGRDKETYHTLAYMYGQEDNMLKDELKSRSRMDTLYTENLKNSFFICPLNEHIQKDDYFIVGLNPIQEYYRVTGYDRQSSKGVQYVTVDPIYEYDLTPPPEKQEGDDDKDFFWLSNGEVN